MCRVSNKSRNAQYQQWKQKILKKINAIDRIFKNTHQFFFASWKMRIRRIYSSRYFQFVQFFEINYSFITLIAIWWFWNKWNTSFDDFAKISAKFWWFRLIKLHEYSKSKCQWFWQIDMKNFEKNLIENSICSFCIYYALFLNFRLNMTSNTILWSRFDVNWILSFSKANRSFKTSTKMIFNIYMSIRNFRKFSQSITFSINFNCWNFVSCISSYVFIFFWMCKSSFSIKCRYYSNENFCRFMLETFWILVDDARF